MIDNISIFFMIDEAIFLEETPVRNNFVSLEGRSTKRRRARGLGYTGGQAEGFILTIQGDYDRFTDTGGTG